MDTPVVSVVIPAYDPGTFLREALRSLVVQTFDAWEAHVVDDGSTEDLSYVTAFDPRIALVRQENQGLSAARNAGIERSSGEYVAFLDADDVWYPRKLERQLKLMTGRLRMLASSTAFDIVDGQGVRVGPGYQDYHTSYVELLQGNGICVSTVMARRKTLVEVGQFDLAYEQAQDWALWLQISKKEPFGYVDEPSAGYRVHQGSMSVDYRRLLREATGILDAHRLSASNSSEASAAMTGKRRVRRLCGAQAYDVFRVSRRPMALRDALRFAPGYTLRSLLKYAASVPARRRR